MLEFNYVIASEPHNIKQTVVGQLSPAEYTVLILMAEGHSNPSIAKIRKRSIQSVESHVMEIYGKFGLSKSRLAEAGQVDKRVMAVLTYLRYKHLIPDRIRYRRAKKSYGL